MTQTPSERAAGHRECQARYQKTAKGKATQRRFAVSEKGVLHKRLYASRTRTSPERRAKHQREMVAYYQATIKPNAHTRRWPECDIRLIFDAQYSDRELSQILDRSMAAIADARVRYKHFAPTGWLPKGTKRKEP